jgi:hypothetical protein
LSDSISTFDSQALVPEKFREEHGPERGRKKAAK